MPRNKGSANKEVVFIVDVVVRSKSGLVEIGMDRECLNPVSRSLLKARSGQRIGFQYRHPLGAELRCGNDISRKRLSCGRIGRYSGFTKKCIVWIEQIAQISCSHCECRNRPGGVVVVTSSNPFLSKEKKQLAPVRIEFARYIYGASNIKSEVVVVLFWRRGILGGDRAIVSRPSVCVKCSVSQYFVSVAVELLCSAFRDEPNLSSIGAAVFSVVVPSKHLNFLNRIHVLCSQHRSGLASPRGERAVYINRISVGSTAVYAKCAAAYAIGIECGNVGAYDTWFEQR